MSANLKSEIAAAQKARARYGRFFSKERLCQMAGLSNLQELAASIRENSFYADGFGNLSDAAVNRESLEKILKERLYTDLARAFRFRFCLRIQALPPFDNRLRKGTCNELCEAS